jgi:hypothetical protein
MFIRVSTAIALAAAIGGCAHAYEPRAYEPREGRDGILAELPADAPPGDCYARVRAPQEPAGPPPAAVGAQWVLTPGPLGSPGPIWCLVPTGPARISAPPVVREGWIRVLCDQDTTPDRIRHVQRKLHERGYYRGQESGRYDQATSAAVARFQHETRIAHGGYLSLDTLQALDGGVGYPESYGAPGYAYGYGYDYAQPGYGQSFYGSGQSGYAYSQSTETYGQSGYAYGYGQPGQAYGDVRGGYDRYSSGAVYGGQGYAYGVAVPPSPCAQPFACAAPAPVAPPPPMLAAPCCIPVPVQPCCAGWGGGGGYGYGVPIPAYAAGSRSAIQNGWLTWQGKSRF